MNFSCTNNTLKALGSYRPDTAKLEDILAVIQDVMKDAADETGKNIYELSASPNAVLFWLAISRAFLKMDVSSASGELSERQKVRLAEVRKALEETSSEIAKEEESMKQAAAETEALEKQLEELRAQRGKQESEEARVKALEEEIARLKYEIENARHIDTSDIEAKKSALIAAQGENAEKALALAEAKRALEAEEAKNKAVDIEIDEAKKRQAEVEAQTREKTALLNALAGEYERKSAELSEQISRIAAENENNDKELAKYRTELEEKKTISRGFESNLAELIKEIENKRSSNETLIKELQDYRERLREKEKEHQAKKSEADGIRAEVASLSDEMNALNTEISRLGEQRKALIEENNNKRIMLANNDPEVLLKEIEEMDRTIKENEQKCTELKARKSELSEKEKRLTETGEALTAEIEELSEKLKQAEEKSAEHERSLRELTERNDSYKKLFDSEKYTEEARKIDSLRKAANIYADGVERLLSYMNEQSAGDASPDMSARLEEARSLLSSQLKETQDSLGKLRSGYISIIEKTENEVNQNAM